VAETISLIDGVLTTHHVIHDQLYTTQYVNISDKNSLLVLSVNKITKKFVNKTLENVEKHLG